MQSRDPFKKMIREDYDIPPAGWSNWVLVLRQTTSCSDFDICMHRSEDNIGYYSNGWYNAETVEDKSGACGIFELRLAGNYTNWPVYLGSTHRECGHESLKDLVNDFLKNGNKKRLPLNKALLRNFRVEVRIKACNEMPSTKEGQMCAEMMENEILKEYDYPWNERRNDYRGCRRFMEDTSKMSLFF